MNRKIELAKKKRANEAEKRKLIKDSIESNQSLQKAIESLYKALNDQEPLDLSTLEKQLESMNAKLNMGEHFNDLKEAIQAIPQPKDSTKIEGLASVLNAIKANKPVPTKINLDGLEKAIVNIEQYIRDNSQPTDQDASSFQPVRRVVKMGNRLIYDDTIPTGSSGGGGSSIEPFLVDGALPVRESRASTSSVTSVAGSDSSVQLLASTASRLGAYFYNDSSADCYIKLGTTASTSSFTIKMAANSYYELATPVYTGRIDAIWSSATGSVRITELA